MDKEIVIDVNWDTDCYRIAARTIRKFRRKMIKRFGSMLDYDTNVYMFMSPKCAVTDTESNPRLIYELIKDGEPLGELQWANPSSFHQELLHHNEYDRSHFYPRLNPTQRVAMRMELLDPSCVKLTYYGYRPCHIKEDADDLFEAVAAYESGWEPSPDGGMRPKECSEFEFIDNQRGN